MLKQQWQGTGADSHSIVVIDGLLSPSKRQEIFNDFPSASWPLWDKIGNPLQAKKLSCEQIQAFPSSLSGLLHELNSGPTLRFLERLTGMDGLMPDPHLWGGGLHLIQPGGYLWPHTDFLQGKTANFMRVINLILYVHPRWEAEMGGDFQIWNGDSLAQSIVPKPGRCVIFKTDVQSIHGVSQVKGPFPRNSVALFYYQVMKGQSISLDYTTGWRFTLAPEGSLIGTMRRMLAAALMRASFGLKRAAIALNEKAENIANTHWP